MEFLKNDFPLQQRKIRQIQNALVIGVVIGIVGAIM